MSQKPQKSFILKKRPRMKIMSYLCRAERQVLAKTYAGSPDLNLSVPSRDTQVCQTNKPRLCVSSIVGCQQKQHGFFACVYQIRTTTKQLSTDLVNEKKKCLVESGKVIPSKGTLYSRRGNVSFPTWEQFIPKVGIVSPFCRI